MVDDRVKAMFEKIKNQFQNSNLKMRIAFPLGIEVDKKKYTFYVAVEVPKSKGDKP